MEKWTLEQELAIDAAGSDILVSASAGSGKTSVMIERIIRLVLSGKTGVKRMLVVTFVSTAAQEMKRKLYDALYLRVAAGKEVSRLSRELDALDTADISTLHGFCADFLRRYFYEADLDAQFKIISGQDAEILKGQALDETIEHFVDADDEAFAHLITIFTRKRRDTAFREMILRVYEFAMAQRNPEKYLEETLDCAYSRPGALEAYLNTTLAELGKSHTEALSRCAERLEDESLPRHAEILKEICLGLREIDPGRTLKENCDRLQRIAKPARAPSIPKDAGLTAGIAVEEFRAVRESAMDFIRDFLEEFGEAAREKERSAAGPAKKYLGKLAGTLRYFMQRFAELKTEKNAVDFNDLEHKTLAVLEKKNVAEAVRGRYDYVFVDEFQDINDVQEAILAAVSSGDNRFAVGDVKQSIYAFRLCDPTIFTGKYRDFKSGIKPGIAVDLNRNFRSRPAILEFVNTVFRRICTEEFGGVDYLRDSMLTPGAEFSQESPGRAVSVRLVHPARRAAVTLSGIPPYTVGEGGMPEEDAAEAEARMIAKAVFETVGTEWYDLKSKEMRRAGFGDIVFLTRSMSDYTRRIGKHLADWGIPVALPGEEGGGAEVRLLIQLLFCMDNPQNDLPLVAVMRSPFGGFSEEELAEIRYRWGGKAETAFHQGVYLAAEHPEDALGKKAADFLGKLERYRLKISFRSVARVLSEAISECGYDVELAAMPKGRERLLKVTAYLNQLENSEIGHTLTGYLRQMEDGKLSLGDTSVTQENSIRFLSIHKSKGLEFPFVFLISAGQRYNLSDLSGQILLDKAFGAALDSYDLERRTKTSTMAKAALRRKKRREMLEEELRVLYVALTRAQNGLVITGKCDPSRWTEHTGLASLLSVNSPLDFLSKELIRGAGGNAQYDFRVYREEELEKEQRPSMPRRTLPAETGEEAKAELSRILSYEYPYGEAAAGSQKFTVTKLSETAEEEKTAPAQVLFSESARDRGIAYHAVLERVDYLDPTPASVRRAMEEAAAILPAGAEEVDAELVLAYLTGPLAREAAANRIFREKTFMLYVSPEERGGKGKDKVLVQGKIDLLIVEPDGCVVVDFKSAYLTSPEEARSRYGSQLDWYAYAAGRILNLPIKRKIVYSIPAKKALEC